MKSNNDNLLDETLRVRISHTLKNTLIEQSGKLNLDLSEHVRQVLSFNQRKKRFIGCLDCHTIHTPIYMVKDSVWLSAIPNYNQIKNNLTNTSIELCFNCLETRLGRGLTIEDFDLTLPINYSIKQGYLMGNKQAMYDTITKEFRR